MSIEDRKEIFFLRVNDEMFKPEIDPRNHKIDMEVHQAENLEKVKISDMALNDYEIGHLIIA